MNGVLHVGHCADAQDGRLAPPKPQAWRWLACSAWSNAKAEDDRWGLRWQAEGVWERIHHAVLGADRERVGRKASPTAAILDNQSVRTAEKKGLSRQGCEQEDHGSQAAHLDRHGRPLTVQVNAGSVQDHDGAKPLPRAFRRLWCFVETVFADGGNAGKLVDLAKQRTHLALEIMKRPRALPRFEPLPRRWVMERSLARLIASRRLVRDFEQRTDVAETLTHIAATATMLRRTA
jgi:transposase